MQKMFDAGKTKKTVIEEMKKKRFNSFLKKIEVPALIMVDLETQTDSQPACSASSMGKPTYLRFYKYHFQLCLLCH